MNELTGFGLVPPWTTPLGLPAVVVPPRPGVRAIDRTAATLGRVIDPVTGDYRLDADGRPALMSGVRQRVQLALATMKGSSVVPWLGQDLARIEDMTPDTEKLIETTIRNALARLVASGEVELVAITIQPVTLPGASSPSAVATRVRWRDLSAVGLPEHMETL